MKAKYFKMIFPPVTITGSLAAVTYILSTVHSMMVIIIDVIIVVLIGFGPLFIDDKKMKKWGPGLIVLYSILSIIAIAFVIYFCSVAKVIITEPFILGGSIFLIDFFKFH